LLGTYLHHGIVWWDVERGTANRILSLNTTITSFSICHEKSLFSIQTMRDGFSLHSVADGSLLCVLQNSNQDSQDNAISLISAFAHGGRALATGSSLGKVRIWNTKTGQVMQTLRHPTSYSVRAVATFYDYDLDIFYVATGSSLAGSISQIWVWATSDVEDGKLS